MLRAPDDGRYRTNRPTATKGTIPMSGGSFEYLCYSEPADLFGKSQQIEEMVRYLSENGHVDAATETESVLLILRHFEARMYARIQRLKPVWKAAEWHNSGDWSADQVEYALKAYRLEAEGLAAGGEQGTAKP